MTYFLMKPQSSNRINTVIVQVSLTYSLIVYVGYKTFVNYVVLAQTMGP